MGLELFGQSIAIVIRAITLSAFVPKFIAFNLSLGFYSVVVFLSLNHFHALNINSACEDKLRMLPGGGKKIARDIFESRPYYGIEDLFRVKGVNKGKIHEVKHLVRYY